MASESPVEKAHDIEKDSITSLPLAAPESGEHLTRALSSRQVSMIAIGGSIGTGLFLGTGRALATGGPGSLLLNYSLVGAVVFLVMLCLGEMATEFPLAGSFSTYSARFVDEPFGFSIGWNYAFNDAISTAGDLTAAQLLMEYWIPSGHLVWLPSLFFLAFIVVINLIHVKAYGELEYWLSSLKVISIIIFFFLGIAVNAGGNTSHEYIGAKYWTLDDAPFVGGFGGFASLFVTASFAYGGTESIGITAGERNPTRNVPRVINRVFFRILIFYILTVILIGFDIPYNFPNLSTKSTATSPFTLVFAQAGSKAGGSFMNAVILTSVISAGNHALFAGARVVYGLSAIGQAPRVFLHTNRNGVPWVAVLLVASVSLIFFGASFLPGGAGQIWDWVQNLVGIAWWCIGVSSWRFRRAWVAQGRKISELKFSAASPRPPSSSRPPLSSSCKDGARGRAASTRLRSCRITSNSPSSFSSTSSGGSSSARARLLCSTSISMRGDTWRGRRIWRITRILIGGSTESGAGRGRFMGWLREVGLGWEVFTKMGWGGLQKSPPV